MSVRLKSHLLPTTLEARGTAVPFTTPSLALARVRPDERHKLVLTVRGFGGDGAYVVPWKSVPDLGAMSVHDRALHEEIGATGAFTPSSIRRCALKIASTGLAGPDAAATARAALEAEEQQVLETHFLLVVTILRGLDLNVRELVNLDPKITAWRDVARGYADRIGTALAIPPAEVFNHTAALSRALSPVGFRHAGARSRMRGVLHNMAEFRHSLGNWRGAEKAGLTNTVEAVIETAIVTERNAAHTLQQFDDRIYRPGWPVRDWRRETALAIAICNRISWLLDGWEHVISAWERVRDSTPVAQREAFAQLLPLIPSVPKTEAALAASA